jgi:hypothetical protein
MNTKVAESKTYLANLLEAVQRCVFFLNGSESRINWPIDSTELASRSKDIDLFEALSAVNERFAKLQDTLGSAMRHAALLSGEPDDTFLQVLSFFEKMNVLTSIDDWQAMRALRNLAAHEYEIDYSETSEHFNSLKELIPQLYAVASAFSVYCRDTLEITAASEDFTDDFNHIVNLDDQESKTPDPMTSGLP